jgi:uncharacterized protein
VIAVDTNVLVYAHRREPAEHERAAELLRELAEGREAWAIPWPCVYEFFSVVTTPRIWKEAASTPEQAWLQLEAWFDARGAAICIAHGVERLLTRDRDFALFPELATEDPF